MPLFPDHNALFIHIPKNAGRSIEAALFPPGVQSSSGKRHFLNKVAHLVQEQTRNFVADQFLVGTRDVVLSAQHLTFAEIELLGLLPQSTGGRPFTFCVVRDPYDRAVSSVLHFRNKVSALSRISDHPTPPEIERAIEVWAELPPDNHNYRAHRRPQADFVFDRKTRNTMDMVMRFERIERDFEALVERLGCSNVSLPWVGKSMTEHGKYRDLLTPRARVIIEQLYGCDIELFGYG
jgi:hypothetical protein